MFGIDILDNYSDMLDCFNRLGFRESELRLGKK